MPQSETNVTDVMKIPAKFKEYIWLVNTIRKARRITFAEINERWLETEMSEGIELARSTFNRHKDAIEDIFGIYIDCDRQNGYKYFIGNDYVLREDSVQNWMLSTLTVSNIISESLSLQERILLEHIPSEGENLKAVIEAMKRSVKIVINYRRYGNNVPKEFCLEPYCIKLLKKRWYVLGHVHQNATLDREERDYFATFSFDRIQELRITEDKFVIDPDFDAAEYFRESFGVFVGSDIPVEKVVLRAYSPERYYMYDLPLHSTQRVVKQGEDYTDFELTLRPTLDLTHHLLSRGNLIKVLSPEWLAKEVRDMHLESARLYEPAKKEKLKGK